MPPKNFLLAAHDPGGANVLMPLANRLSEQHSVLLFPGGPAIDIWKSLNSGPNLKTADGMEIDEILMDALPDLIVTGTSLVSDFERLIWRLARQSGRRTTAVLDASMNLERRFLSDIDEESNLPDAICANDPKAGQQLSSAKWCTARIHVTGQAYLEATIRNTQEIRSGRVCRPRPLMVFFSEPIATDHTGEQNPGYDQFSVATLLSKIIGDWGPVDVQIQPHPREDKKIWLQWLENIRPPENASFSIATASTDELLTQADGIMGMTSMVLLQAALSGIPTASFQPDRRLSLNQKLDETTEIIMATKTADSEYCIDKFFAATKAGDRPMTKLSTALDGSIERLFQAVMMEEGT